LELEDILGEELVVVIQGQNLVLKELLLEVHALSTIILSGRGVTAKVKAGVRWSRLPKGGRNAK